MTGTPPGTPVPDNSTPSNSTPSNSTPGNSAPDQARPNLPFTSETAGLPSWLFPAGFWVAVVALALAVLFPGLALLAVAWVMLVPVLAALWVAASAWKLDRRLSVAALVALIGLAVVFLAKNWISHH
jgi:hypothetical protein